MREIIFRGKRKDNGEWIEGFYVRIGSTNHFIFTGKLKIVGCMVDYECYEVIPETVGQYTGLKDKNGTKIFEGDILLKGFEKVLVKLNSNQCRWGIYSNGYEISGFNESTKNYFEVIGNIHENKNLLEE